MFAREEMHMERYIIVNNHSTTKRANVSTAPIRLPIQQSARLVLSACHPQKMNDSQIVIYDAITA